MIFECFSVFCRSCLWALGICILNKNIFKVNMILLKTCVLVGLS